jgi:hypothetical protein
MGFLEPVLNDPVTQRRVEDFIGRYEQGAPADGIGDRETLEHHQQLAAEATPEQYQQAAWAAFSRLGPQDRARLGQQLQGSARAHGLNLAGLLGGVGGQLVEPGTFAQLVGQLHQQRPGLLVELLGGRTAAGGSGSGGRMLVSPVARAALAGIAAMLAKQALTGRR